jgi:hypothetical protein
MFVPDASLPTIRQESNKHFFLYPSASGFSVIPLTGFGGVWLSEITGRDADVTLTRDAAINLLLEFYSNESSPTLD